MGVAILRTAYLAWLSFKKASLNCHGHNLVNAISDGANQRSENILEHIYKLYFTANIGRANLSHVSNQEQ